MLAKFLKNSRSIGMSSAKSLVAELAPPYAQSAWRSKGERIRTAGLKKKATSSINCLNSEF